MKQVKGELSPSRVWGCASTCITFPWGKRPKAESFKDLKAVVNYRHRFSSGLGLNGKVAQKSFRHRECALLRTVGLGRE
jgi:hypothetical protein